MLNHVTKLAKDRSYLFILMHALTKDFVTKKLTEKFMASFTHVDINLFSDIHLPKHKQL